MEQNRAWVLKTRRRTHHAHVEKTLKPIVRVKQWDSHTTELMQRESKESEHSTAQGYQTGWPWLGAGKGPIAGAANTKRWALGPQRSEVGGDKVAQ